MLTVTSFLIVSAAILTIVSAAWGRVPLWIPVLLICLVLLLGVLPR